jgi:hypothetical protein
MMMMMMMMMIMMLRCYDLEGSVEDMMIMIMMMMMMLILGLIFNFLSCLYRFINYFGT